MADFLNQSGIIYTSARNNGVNQPITDVSIKESVGYDATDDMMKIKSTQKKWKDSFAQTTLNTTTKWDVVQTGAGMTIDASAIGSMTISGGTTANSETIIRSKEYFTIPARALFMFSTSQKIANQDVVVEFISVDPTTFQPDGIGGAGFRISYEDSTTANYCVVTTTAGGSAVSTSPAYSSGITMTSQNIYEIELFSDEVWFHHRVADSETGRVVSKVRNSNIPDPNAIYKVQIRVKNKATAPASNTNVIFQGVTVVDYAELTAEITAGRGATSAGQALAVQVANTIPAVTTVSTAYQAPKTSRASITSTAITTATPFQQTALDIGATASYDTYRMRFTFDQPVKVEVQHGSSSTNTSNRVQSTYFVPANTPTIIDEKLLYQYVSVKITNIGSATTTVQEAYGTLMCIGNINNSNQSAVGSTAITPSDTATIPATKGIFIGGAGNLAVTMANGNTVTFTGLSAGVVHPISVTKISATGTTATSILALY
jgi:hypothetical protein